MRRTVLAGRRVLVSGRLRPAGAGEVISLQVRSQRAARWVTVDHAATDHAGRYRLTTASSDRAGTVTIDRSIVTVAAATS